jgi:hypothetical protein
VAYAQLKQRRRGPLMKVRLYRHNCSKLVGGVPHGVLNIPMAETILDELGAGSLVGQREAAGMAQHLGMY